MSDEPNPELGEDRCALEVDLVKANDESIVSVNRTRRFLRSGSFPLVDQFLDVKILLRKKTEPERR